ncbi:tail fiber assembly protein [Pantoea agglomerans]|uniref:tail fiber assembly protein n=1 Tax=Enterobacter agglomerans TaxID=549 RepID=UPI00384F93E5
MVIMKNFTVENVDLDGLLIAVATDETGADWYASQRLFQPDTLKFVFDKNGVVISMNHDVSALWPGGHSVAEIASKDVPAGLSINGEWVFDGERILPRTYTLEQWQAKAESMRQSLLKEAGNVITDWRTELQLGILNDEDKANLIEWMGYIKSVKTLDLSLVEDEATLDKVAWPEKPKG